MKLIIISGLSGSGKTIALHTLEDEDYYCVDNLPLGLLPGFVQQIQGKQLKIYDQVAVGIDARSEAHDLRSFREIVDNVRESDIDVEIIYFQAELTTLIKRFSDTRRRHPLTRKGMPLSEAIEVERALLGGISDYADRVFDTTFTNIHELRDMIREQVVTRTEGGLSVLFQSFGYKNGAPTDSDFVFDVRCLPNPHWEPALRSLTGQDSEVIAFLQAQDSVQLMLDQIRTVLQEWIPMFEKQNRIYLTISIGCTGGQHRSVYFAEQLCDDFRDTTPNISLRHRELQ